ncbi:MAG: AsnC family transcriptional regulator, partial [Actinobacteria bacterium]
MAKNRRPNGANANDSSIDEISRRIVAELQGEGRLTIAELGRRVGLSAP